MACLRFQKISKAAYLINITYLVSILKQFKDFKELQHNHRTPLRSKTTIVVFSIFSDIHPASSKGYPLT